jgi:Glycosyl transferases group 1
MTQKQNSRRILIVEKNPDGHRLHYVAILARESLDDGAVVTVATSSSARSSDEWRMYLGEFAAQVSVVELTDFGVRDIWAAAQELGIDHVVVPDGDAFAYALARPASWPGGASVSALVMRPTGQPSRVVGMAALKTVLKRSMLLLASCNKRVQIRILKSSTWHGVSLIPAVRDPVMVQPFTEEDGVLSVKTGVDRYWFGVVGAVGFRKNLHMIAEALEGLEGSAIGLVVAGRIQPGVLEASQPHLDRFIQAGGDVKVVDRLLEDHELDQLISDLDCVVLAHSNEGSSGVLGKAMALGTRVIAAGAKSLKADCRRVSAGAEWVPLRVKDLRGALARATTMPPPLPLLTATPSDFAAGLLR